jgi:hypothetical protein
MRNFVILGWCEGLAPGGGIEVYTHLLARASNASPGAAWGRRLDDALASSLATRQKLGMQQTCFRVITNPAVR